MIQHHDYARTAAEAFVIERFRLTAVEAKALSDLQLAEAILAFVGRAVVESKRSRRANRQGLTLH